MPKPENLSIADLAADNPQTIADQCSMPVIYVDHQATRRNRLHGINLPGHEQGFSSSHLNEILEHLHTNGFLDAILICETPGRHHLACYIQVSQLEQNDD